MAYETTVKYLRTHLANITDGNLNSVMMWHLKLIYEFWGFCVNGSNNLRAPGGMPISSSNYLSMSFGFESGSSVLLASGSDGSTTYGEAVFTAPSIDWTSGTMINKHIVAWQSASSCTDDSIYRILRVINSSSVLVSVENGGTPVTGSLVPRFTTRTNINFRVIDLRAVSLMSGSAGMYMILQTNAQAINSGQLPSQVKLVVRAGNSSISSCALALSPSGSWNGSAFTDITPELAPDGATETGGVGYATYDWFNGSAGQGSISLWGDQGALMMHSRGSWNTAASIFHFEIPRRLFPIEKDPNPICCLNIGKRGMTTKNIDTTRSEHFSAGWVVANEFDNSVLRRWVALVQSFSGGFFDSNIYSSGDGAIFASERFKDAYTNMIARKHLLRDVLLGHRQTTASYSIGRVQLRRAAIAHSSFPISTKFGANGDWIHIGDGVVWPWDNTQLVGSILASGG